MNEATMAKSPNFGAMQQIMERLVLALIGLDRQLLARPVPQKAAAE